jgi:hypothetical protein
MKIICTVILLLTTTVLSTTGQSHTELLGRPANSSVTISILFDQSAEVYYSSTDPLTAAPGVPLEYEFTGLSPDTKYYYRTGYRPAGSSAPFTKSPEHTFHTQRPAGSTFTFAVEADPHLDSNSVPAAFSLTLQNILSAQPDFMLDLGDIFMSEKIPGGNQTEIINRHLLYRPYFNEVCTSVPLFLVLGNHEGEQGWRLDGTPDNAPVRITNVRKIYYPNPIPGAFYSGDTKEEEFVGLRENYYAWEWGGALFIVIEPYWYTTNKVGWGWTLGETQYNWFKKTISESTARFKFVFAHQLIGGDGTNARGGIEFAHLYEMGGYNTDSTWGFDANRPGWDKPIHNLMAENKATIFFHGHDHFFAKQEKDGVVYQEVPQPSSRNITNLPAGSYGYVKGDFLTSRGYILVTVTDSTVKADYIRTFLPNEEKDGHVNGEVAYSYTVHANPAGMEEPDGGPLLCRLEQNFPNPFSTGTSVKYSLYVRNHVQVKLYNVFGKEIATLADQEQSPGEYVVPVPVSSLSLSNGIYYCRLVCGDYSKVIKMICIK